MKTKIPQIFFNKNKLMATKHLRNLQDTQGSYFKRFKKIRLYKIQYPHIDNWKTWEMTK